MKKSKKQRNFDKKRSNAYDQNKKKIILYKTEFCRSFEETGYCRYKEKCQFAHSIEELRPVDRHPKYRTEMCKTFWEQGTCPYGKRCCFIHTFKEDIKNEDLIPNKLIESKINQLNTPTSTPKATKLTFDSKSNYLLNGNSETPNMSRLSTNSNDNSNLNTNKSSTGVSSNVNVNIVAVKDSKMNVNAKAFEPSIKNKLISSLQNTISTPQQKNGDNFSDLSTGSTLYSNTSTLPLNNSGNVSGSNSSEIFPTSEMQTLFDYDNPNFIKKYPSQQYCNSSSNPEQTMTTFQEKNELTENNPTEAVHSRITEDSIILGQGNEMNHPMFYLHTANGYPPFQNQSNINVNVNLNTFQDNGNSNGMAIYNSLFNHGMNTLNSMNNNNNNLSNQLGNEPIVSTASLYSSMGLGLYNKMGVSEKSLSNTPKPIINSPGFSGQLKSTVMMNGNYRNDQEMLYASMNLNNDLQQLHPNISNNENSSPESVSFWMKHPNSMDKLNLLNSNNNGNNNATGLMIKNSNSIDDYSFSLLQKQQQQQQQQQKQQPNINDRTDSINHPMITHQTKNNSMGSLQTKNLNIIDKELVDSSTSLLNVSFQPMTSSIESHSPYVATSTTTIKPIVIENTLPHNFSQESFLSNSRNNHGMNGQPFSNAFRHWSSSSLPPTLNEEVNAFITNTNDTSYTKDTSINDEYLIYKDKDVDIERAKLFGAFINPKFHQMNDYFKSIHKHLPQPQLPPQSQPQLPIQSQSQPQSQPPHPSLLLPTSSSATTSSSEYSNPPINLSFYGKDTISTHVMPTTTMFPSNTFKNDIQYPKMDDITSEFSTLSINSQPVETQKI